MNKKILCVLTRHNTLGSSSRLRFTEFFKFLESEYEIHHNALLSDKYLVILYEDKKLLMHKYLMIWNVILGYFNRVKFLFKILILNKNEVLWVEKEIFPYAPYVIERMIIKFFKISVFDYDDAIYERYNEERNLIVRWIFSKKIKKIMNLASLVTVGNNKLYGYAQEANAKIIKKIPTLIDDKKIKVGEKDKKESNFVIGWIGTQSSIIELVQLLEWVAESDLRNKVKFKIIGAKISYPNLNIDCIEWNPDNEIENLHNIDVGVMPLLKNKFNEGKCGYKLLQYMACGKPVIATAWGMNKDIVNDKKIGILADNKSEWIEAIKYFVNNKNEKVTEDMRVKIIRDYYSISSNINIIKESLNGV